MYIDRKLTIALLAASLLPLLGCPQFPEENNASGTTGQNNSQNNTTIDPGPAEERECSRVVEYQGGEGASSVIIAGEFNDWDINATPLERSEGIWRAEVQLEPGDYAYKFVIDGEYEGEPPPDVPTKWAGDIENRNLRVDDCSIPAWKVVSNDVSEDGEITVTLKFVSATGGAKIDPTSLDLSLGNIELDASSDAVDVDVDQGVVQITYQA